MSSNRKRLALLAGASLVLAGLALAPGAALAADECGNPDTNTTGADTFTCSGTFASVVYPDTNGNLTLNLANDLAVTTGGISASGTLANSVSIGRANTGLNTLDPVVTNTGGAGIAVNNASGAVTVNLTDPAFATGPGIAVTGTTYGVQLATGSTGGVAFTQTNGSITASGASGVGLQAAATGSGSVSLNIGGLITGATGVQATTGGAGSLSVTLAAPVAGSSAVGEIAGGSGPAILLTPNAAATLTFGAGSIVRADGGANAVVNVTNLNGALTFSNLGTLRSNDTTAAGYDDLVFSVGGGAGAITQTNGAPTVPPTCIPGFGCFGGSVGGPADIRGRYQLANTGATTITLNETTVWRTSGANLLGEGNTTLAHTASALILAATGGVDTELDFGGGTNLYNQAGVLAVGGGTEAATTFTMTGLTAWNLSGAVLFGANGTNTASDGVANDLIVAEGARLIATGAARLFMDIDLSGAQSDCAVPTVADCLVLTGGGVQGVVPILVNDVGVDPGFSSGGILLVDVSGGTSNADRFVLDPASADYANDPTLGRILDRGLYFYSLSYDEDAQQHFIVGMPKREVVQLSTLGHTAQAVWRMNTASWFDRQADMRGMTEGREPGTAPGVWLKAVGGSTDRTIDQSGALFTYRALAGYDQKSVGLVGGVDLVSFADEDRAYAAGVTAGYAQSDVTFKSSLTKDALEGYSLGAYASYVSGPFFIDGVVGGTWLDVDYDAPDLGLTGATAASGRLESFGGQVEAGLRLPVNGGDAFLEPLAALSYVTTDVGDFTLPGGAFGSDDLTSFRGSLGARLSGDLAMDTYTLRMGLIARAWEEFEGENRSTVTAADGAVIPLLDDVSGTVNEVGLDLALYSNGGWSNLSVLLSAGIEFADDYKNSTGSLGFRYQW